MALILVSLHCNCNPTTSNPNKIITKCDDAQKVKKGNFLKMHYTGTIDQSSATGEKGKKFDSSRDRGQTFDVAIGTGQVIKGWDEGIVGLCLGAKANLIIVSYPLILKMVVVCMCYIKLHLLCLFVLYQPPEMGYGDRG